MTENVQNSATQTVLQEALIPMKEEIVSILNSAEENEALQCRILKFKEKVEAVIDPKLLNDLDEINREEIEIKELAVELGDEIVEERETEKLESKLEQIKARSGYVIEVQLICKHFNELPEYIQGFLNIISQFSVDEKDYGNFLLNLSQEIKKQRPIISLGKKPFSLNFLNNQAKELINEHKERARKEK